jgi:hypothetical protein
MVNRWPSTASSIELSLSGGLVPAGQQEARCSNKLLEHLDHLHETNDLFGKVAKSRSLFAVSTEGVPHSPSITSAFFRYESSERTSHASKSGAPSDPWQLAKAKWNRRPSTCVQLIHAPETRGKYAAMRNEGEA